ncbi:MAG: flavodoxin [Pseudomonadota bacterium]
MKIGMVYGSTTGNTRDAARAIRAQLEGYVDEIFDVEGLELAKLTEFDVLLVGIPTWDIGELQESWDQCIEKLDDLSFDGKQVAFFGDGDQCSYPFNFQDAMGILRDRFVARGATADIGHWPTDEYDYQESRAIVDGMFCGLPLDDLYQPEQTEERIQIWVEQILEELGITESQEEAQGG